MEWAYFRPDPSRWTVPLKSFKIIFPQSCLRNKNLTIGVERRKKDRESESPLKYESASYFSIANYAFNLDSCGEYSLRTWSTFDHWKRRNWGVSLTRFRPTSEVDLIPGPEQGFDIVGGYFSADLKSFLSHSSNMHFHITRSSIAFLKKKFIFLC